MAVSRNSGDDRDRFVYVLIDPRDDKPYYVGATVNPNRRLAQHIAHRFRKNTLQLRQWICDVVDAGLRPVLRVVERSHVSSWEIVETRWISKLRENGAPLLNGARGGLGTPGFQHSHESREKMSASHAGKQLGMKRSEKVRRNNSEAQKQRWEYERQNGIVRPPRVLSEESLRKMSVASTGKKRTETQREALRAIHADPNGPFQTEAYRQKKREEMLSRDPRRLAALAALKTKGVPKSPETRAKMADAARRRWARKSDV